MKTLLENSCKGFICTPESDLKIPIVNGFINQDLYQECYNWIASYYKIPIRFFPLFRDGAFALDDEKADLMKKKYGIDCTPPMLLSIFRTYFKDARDLRALTLAYANTLKNVNLVEEDRLAFTKFLDATEHETRHINYIARIKTVTVIQETLKLVDLALRANRTNFVETLLILETAEDANMLGRLINIYEEDFKYMFSLPEYAIKENICIYIWFFEKVLRCLEAYKSLQDLPFVRALCRGCKTFTRKVVYSENDFNSLQKIFGWSEDLIRYMNLICLTHLRARFFPHNSHVKLSEYVESSAILFSKLIRKKEWLEEAEIVFDLYELGQREVEHTDLMKVFVKHLNTEEPLEFFEDAYRICSKYPMEIAQLIECGFLRNKECTALPIMDEKAKILTFYNKLHYEKAADVLKNTSKDEIVEILASTNISRELFVNILSNDYFDIQDLSEMIQSNRGIARNFSFILKCEYISVVKELILKIFKEASLEFLNENLKVFEVQLYSLRYLNVNFGNITNLISSKFVREDKELVRALASKFPYIGLFADYEGFYRVLALYLKEFPDNIENAEELLKAIEDHTDANIETLGKIARNIMNDEEFKAYYKKINYEKMNDSAKQLTDLKEDFSECLQYTDDFQDVVEQFNSMIEEVEYPEFTKDLLEMMVKAYQDIDEILDEIQALAEENGIVLDIMTNVEEGI